MCKIGNLYGWFADISSILCISTHWKAHCHNAHASNMIRRRASHLPFPIIWIRILYIFCTTKYYTKRLSRPCVRWEFLVYDMPRWQCILFHIISIVILFRIANAAVGWRILYHSFRETYCYKYICIHISNIYCKRNSNTRYKISFSCFWVWYTHRILLLYVTGVFCTLYVHSGWVFLLPNVYAEQFHTYIYRGHIFSLSILCQGRFGCRGEWKSLAHAMCVRILLFFFVSLESS